jgi:hypothetical protein
VEEKCEKVMLPKIIEHLESCRPKEVGQHAEKAFVCINNKNYKEFLAVLVKRRDNVTDAQKKRIDKLINKMKNNIKA